MNHRIYYLNVVFMSCFSTHMNKQDPIMVFHHFRVKQYNVDNNMNSQSQIHSTILACLNKHHQPMLPHLAAKLGKQLSNNVQTNYSTHQNTLKNAQQSSPHDTYDTNQCSLNDTLPSTLCCLVNLNSQIFDHQP